MWTRLMDLVLLVAEMTRQADCSYVELDRELLSRGYSPDEIEHAVFWVSSRPDWGRGRGGRSVRVLSDFERMSLSTAAFDYIFRLLNLGIIDGRQCETIITRAIPVGTEKVHVDDVKEIACSVIFEGDAEEDAEEEVLDRFDAGGAPF